MPEKPFVLSFTAGGLLYHESIVLAEVYVECGQWDRAIEAIRVAWTQRPDSPNLSDKLAWMLVRHEAADPQSVQTAVLRAEFAVTATDRRNARYLHTLALAYAASERLEDALRAAEDGLARARADGDDKLVQWMTEQAADYRTELARQK